MSADFPLIYCNGDSYTDERYHSSLKGAIYVNTVAEHLGGFAINNGINGSCNRRIIRSSMHDLLLQRQHNPNQRIIALIGLSFEIRGEMWDNDRIPETEQESQFLTHKFFSKNENWFDELLSVAKQKDNSFFDKYTQGRAYYYSPYAERINLLCDCVMFQSLMESLNIEFLMFQSPKAEKLETEYLLDFFKSQLKPKNFFDFETFGFANWCNQQGFGSLDLHVVPELRHPDANGHRAFAEQILLPRIKENERRH
jgi:hypothetical protein